MTQAESLSLQLLGQRTYVCFTVKVSASWISDFNTPPRWHTPGTRRTRYFDGLRGTTSFTDSSWHKILGLP